MNNYSDELHDKKRCGRRVELLDQLDNVTILETTKYGHFVRNDLFLTFDSSRLYHLQCKRQLARPARRRTSTQDKFSKSYAN